MDAAIAEKIRAWFNERGSDDVDDQRVLNQLQKLIFHKVKHPVPEDRWIPGASQPGERQTVNAVVSAEYTGMMVEQTIELREAWLVQQNLPLDTCMDDTQRQEFLSYCKELYFKEDHQLDLIARYSEIGGKKGVQKGKHSRWARELQRRCGTKHLWEVISFSGRFDPGYLKDLCSGVSQPAAARSDEEGTFRKKAHHARFEYRQAFSSDRNRQ